MNDTKTFSNPFGPGFKIPRSRLQVVKHKGEIGFKPCFTETEVTFYEYLDEEVLVEGWYEVDLGDRIDTQRELKGKKIFSQRVLNPVKVES